MSVPIGVSFEVNEFSDVNFDNDSNKRRILDNYENNRVAIKADTEGTSTDKQAETSKKAPSSATKQPSLLEKQLFGLNVAAALLPAPFGTVAGMASAGIKAADAIGEWTNKNATRLDAADPSKATQPSDPNNKVLNTNDRLKLDHHQAVNGMLEGQLNHSRSVFIEHQEGGKNFLAYKYQDEKGGDVRYGKRELDKDGKFTGQWQSIPTDSALAKNLDKAHDAKIAEIDSYTRKGEDRSVGVERYRAAKSLEGDIGTLKGLNGGRVEPRHTELVAAMEKINALETRLNNKTDDPKEVKKDFDALLKSSPLLTHTLANTRATHLQNAAPDKFANLTDKLAAVKPVLKRNDFVDQAVEEERNKKQTLSAEETKKLETDFKTFESKTKQLPNDPKNESLKLASNSLMDSYKTKGSTETQGKYMQQQLAYLNSKLDAALGIDKQKTAAKKPDPEPPAPAPNNGQLRVADLESIGRQLASTDSQKVSDAEKKVITDFLQEAGKRVNIDGSKLYISSTNKDSQTVSFGTLDRNDPSLDLRYQAKIGENGDISSVEKFDSATKQWTPYTASEKPVEPANSLDLPTPPEPERVPPKLERVTNTTTKTIAVQEETTTNRIPTLKAGNDLFMKNAGLYIKVGGGNKPDEYFYDKDAKTLTKVQPSTYISDSEKGDYRIAETEDGSQQFASKNGEDYQAMDRVIDGKLAGTYTIDNKTYFAKYMTPSGRQEYDFVSETQNGKVINGSTSRASDKFSFEDRKYYMENYGAIQNGGYARSSGSKLLAIEANSLQEAVSGTVPQEVKDYQKLYTDMVGYQRGDKKIDNTIIENLNQDFALITAQGKLDVDRLRAMRTYLDAMRKNDSGQ